MSGIFEYSFQCPTLRDCQERADHNSHMVSCVIISLITMVGKFLWTYPDSCSSVAVYKRMGQGNAGPTFISITHVVGRLFKLKNLT